MKLCFPRVEDEKVSDLTEEITTHFFFLYCGKNALHEIYPFKRFLSAQYTIIICAEQCCTVGL